MPQERHLLSCTRTLKVERVHAHPAAPGWSPAYRAPSTRLVLPAGGAVELRTRGQNLLADALTVFRVDGTEPYQLRPCGTQERVSVVLSEQFAGVSPSSGTRSADDIGDIGLIDRIDRIDRIDQIGHVGHIAADTGLPSQDTGIPPQPPGWLLAPRALYLLQLHWRALAQGRAAPEATMALVQAALGEAAQARQPGSGGAVGRARRFLAAGPGAAAGVSLSELAEEACCSPFHLARAFRRSLGLSPHQYRLRLRVAQALARLQDGERDLAGLAHDLGFCGQSHLGTVFQREVGVTPGQARAALNA